MINNPLVKKINDSLLEARKKRLLEKKSGKISNETEITVMTLSTLLGEFERKIIGEHKPDISEHRIRGMFKAYVNDIQRNYEINKKSANQTRANEFQTELKILNSLDIIPTKLNEQEIDLQIQKIYSNLSQNPNFLRADNQKYMLEVNFYKVFVPTKVNPDIFRERLNKFFVNKK